ncbi:FAD-dependent oxidoreductase [Xenorhabdus sp. 12]|uniref:FAD-dependent oxidoreductase n=2 Tax=Xenorhabdus santafensis TaxID=2582833 RepID=A0ABU4S3P8_9GAMM|nr:FAD-dependent oxidoreductase [Xenorhabdus sp. 12]
MNSQYDIAVIGAGFAGTVAARDLSNAGYSVVLLEARNRIGGRTYSGEAFGHSVEFGGAYAHWTQPYIWHELQRYGLGINPPAEINKILWLADGTLHSGTMEEFNAIVEPLLKQYLSDARTSFPMPFSYSDADTQEIEKQTLADRLNALNLSAYERDVIDGALSTFVHDWDQQGIAQFLLWAAIYFGRWDAFLETAGFWQLEGGTQRLIQAIHNDSKAELRLSTPVSAIADDGSNVTITTHAGEQIVVKSAVVAVPLNVLSDLQISPQVVEPVRKMIEDKLPMRTIKLMVRVRGELDAFAALAPVKQAPINTVKVEYHHEGDTILVCFISDALSIDANDPNAVQQALRLFVPDIEVVSLAFHDWVDDPFSQGTWVHHRPGNLTGAAPLIRQPHGRIHFAGGDIAAMSVSCIEGAIETGVKASRDVITQLTI